MKLSTRIFIGTIVFVSLISLATITLIRNGIERLSHKAAKR